YDPADFDFVGGTSDRSRFSSTISTADPRLVAPGFIAISAGNDAGVNGAGMEVASIRLVPLKAGTASISIVQDGPFAAAALDPSLKSAAVGVAAGALNIEVRAATIVHDWTQY